MDDFWERQLKKQLDDLYNQLRYYCEKLESLDLDRETLVKKVSSIKSAIRDTQGQLDELKEQREQESNESLKDYISAKYQKDINAQFDAGITFDYFSEGKN